MARLRKYGSNKGRPRKNGERHPSGELVRPGPNKFLIARRAAMCADPVQSTSPLDCAHANGWLTAKEHRTGRQYAGIYRACGFSIGSTTASAESEVDIESELCKLSLSQMSDATIVEAWDKIMDRPLKLGIDCDGALLKEWNRVNRSLSAVQRQQVYLVCVMDSWPQWLIQRHAAKVYRKQAESDAKAERRALKDDELAYIHKKLNSHWERDHVNLTAGLKAIAAALAKPAIEQLPYETAPAPPSRKRPESTVYVDEQGVFIREVVRLVPMDT